MEVITPEKLRELLRYDPETGVFTYRVQRGGRAAGARAGTINKEGYVTIHLCYRLYAAHRLAWLYMKGVWPADLIDHKNCIRSDNIWTNLREADDSLNQQNIRRAPRNKKYSRLLGAVWSKQRSRWASRIRYKGKCRSLGFFESEEDAHEFYMLAKKMCHPGYAG